MNASELKYQVGQAGHDSHFFDRKTMQFFGDSMKNYGVRSAEIISQYNGAGEFVSKEGAPLQVWELYRRRAVKHGLKDSAYFDKATFRRVFSVAEA